MNKFFHQLFYRYVTVIGAGCMAIAFVTSCTPSTSKLSDVKSIQSPPSLQYRLWKWESQQVRAIIVPDDSQWLVKAAVSPELETLEALVRQDNAVAAINAGYFDPQNSQTTSFVFTDGKLTANPKSNPKLTKNPQLKHYLTKIFNRSEFRTYQCQKDSKYEIVTRQAPIPTGCQLVSAVGGGPQLVPEITAIKEGFIDTRSGNIIRDPVGIDRPNARSAVGIMPDGSVILVMVAQSKTGKGLSLPQLQRFLQSLGVVKALALDGGSSSSLYYGGQTFYGKVDATGKTIARPVKSVLLVEEVTN
jgi:exopolysaccharide biosynthesis protein